MTSTTKMKHFLQAIIMRIVEAIFTEECYKMPSSYTVYSCPNYGRYTGPIEVVVHGKDPYEKYMIQKKSPNSSL